MEEIKIIESIKQEDTDFIKDNIELRVSFEKIFNDWFKEEDQEINRRNIDQLFTEFPIFSIMIINNKVQAFAIGRSYNEFTRMWISHVRSNMTGGCTKVINKLLDFWWDKEKLEFKNNFNISLDVLSDNNPAINCYKKFGFNDMDKKYNFVVEKDKYLFDLSKKDYISKYLLPKSIKELAINSFKKNKNLSTDFLLNSSQIINNIQLYLNKL